MCKKGLGGNIFGLSLNSIVLISSEYHSDMFQYYKSKFIFDSSSLYKSFLMFISSEENFVLI